MIMTWLETLSFLLCFFVAEEICVSKDQFKLHWKMAKFTIIKFSVLWGWKWSEFSLNHSWKCLQCWQYKSIVNIKYSYYDFCIILKRSKREIVNMFYIVVWETTTSGRKLMKHNFVLLFSSFKTHPKIISFAYFYLSLIHMKALKTKKK